MSWSRGFRAILAGGLTYIFALIYVPQCRVQVYVENARLIGLAIAAVIAFLAYRFK